MKTSTIFLLAVLSTVTVSAQNVGIAVPAPLNTLDIHRGTARTNTHPGGSALYVTGNGEFRSADATVGFRIISNGIISSGSNTDVDLSLTTKNAGNILFSTNNNLERMRITPSGVGIGTTTPHAPLHFATLAQNRKIVLFEAVNNDHEYYGFGVNGNTLRYQTDQAASDHVFYSAINSSSSRELMRITGDGYVGIGILNTHAPLQFSSMDANRKIVMYEWANNDHEFTGFGQNITSLRYQVWANTVDHVFYAAVNSTTSTELMRIKGTGRVGIGEDAPNEKLEIGGDGRAFFGDGNGATRKGLLIDGNETNGARIEAYDYNIPGGMDLLMNVFGGNVGIAMTDAQNKLDIQTAGRTGTHATGRPLYITGSISGSSNGMEIRHTDGTQGIGFGFNTVYAAGSNTDQNLGLQAKGTGGHLLMTTNGTERMRITGSGNVGIGTSSPNAPLQFNDTPANRKIVLNEAANNDHEFTGFGILSGFPGGHLRYQVWSTSVDHIFYAGSSASTSNLLMRITGEGRVAINSPDYPDQNLYVNGNALVSTHLHVGSGTVDPTKTLNANGDARINGNATITGTLQIGYQNVEQTFVLTGFAVEENTCNCPSGFKAIGGGWQGDNLDVIGSYPTANGSGWTISAINLLPGDIGIDVHAVCLKIAPN